MGEKDKAQDDDGDRAVQVWKIKKLIKALEQARGNGTSMISLIIPPRDQTSRVNKMLSDEYGTASNIKSRVNRQSVLSAITSTQQRLKLYPKVPDNGLVIYCGTIMNDQNKEREVLVDFEPFKPINTSLYLCDNKFHTEALASLLESDEKFGFIVMDGNGALFGLLTGNTRSVLHKFSVDLPKKHGRGGQSALRFARLRLEKRHNFVRKVAEIAVTQFIPDGQKVNVTGLILAGSADFKTELYTSELFDQRLKAKVLKTVDVSYGGENGFNQAIDLSAETLGNVKFIQEKKLVQRYFDEISKDTNKYCFGVRDTMLALEQGAVEILIAWENMEHTRLELENPQTNEKVIKILSKQEMNDMSHFVDQETKVELETREQEPFVDWMAAHYKDFGTTLEFITDRSQEGAQFVQGFGGIGGLMRYEVNFEAFEEPEEDEDWEDLLA
ncbi:Peptide chain release factor eRF, subunit 1 [Chondrus crispus]|uniref:Peptide chain release factor eRF, subunit 1 n=1 Tax=Chondrus crispus TaxID=2769 RepID=R7QAN7_CHOCR|nr:Peptide chain release factor eRF, subunit 1 [Chondrus crispus]CDF34510.1 Peptide chain release factor eRF, subunit 1 [Chondrus crispus]|eukprot:XP_005714329.1 Peptide chain release factor eRF, subunit 1 [Chondrus crispus]